MSLEKFLKDRERDYRWEEDEIKKLIRIVREATKELEYFKATFPNATDCLKRCDEVCDE